MRRGEIWTAAGGSGYAGKPRPVVIVQDDRFDATDSVTICAFSTDPTEAPLLRLRTDPDDLKGLREPNSLMVDKITTVHRTKLGARIGRLADEDMIRRPSLCFWGLADRRRTRVPSVRVGGGLAA
jgi:mRNA interferase MazF